MPRCRLGVYGGIGVCKVCKFWLELTDRMRAVWKRRVQELRPQRMSVMVTQHHTTDAVHLTRGYEQDHRTDRGLGIGSTPFRPQAKPLDLGLTRDCMHHIVTPLS